jgi:hypothetical protein
MYGWVCYVDEKCEKFVGIFDTSLSPEPDPQLCCAFAGYYYSSTIFDYNSTTFEISDDCCDW